MDELDRRIIKELQDNFPLDTDPYAVMARNLGITSEQLWQRVVELVESGVIRRLGFSIDSRKIGHTSTLVAIRIPAEQVQAATELMEAFPQITHSYLRDDAFNIWFTVIEKDAEHIQAVLDQIRQQLGLSEEDIMNLPADKFFKLDTRFKS